MGRTKTISDEALLEVARRVFVELGFAAPSKEIAKRAGVSEGVLFQRFETKEELFFAAMIPPPVDLHELFEAPPAQDHILIEKIVAAMIEYFRATLPVLIQLMSHPSFRFEDFAKRQPNSPLVTLRRQLIEFVMREKVAGRIGDVDPGAAALLIWSVAHSIAFFERMGAHDGVMPPSIVQATIRGLWTGLSPAKKT